MLYLGQLPPALITAFAFTLIIRIVLRRALKRPPTVVAVAALSFAASVLLFVLSVDKPFTHGMTDLVQAVALYVPAQAIASVVDRMRMRRHAAIASGD